MVFTKGVAIVSAPVLDSGQGGSSMDQRSIEKHLRRWHRRDKTAGDDLPRGGASDASSTAERKLSATTGSGLSIESQVRKEWDPTRGGGLPTFFTVCHDD